MKTLRNIEKLLLTIAINDKIVDASEIMDERTKVAFRNLSKFTRDLLEKEPMMKSQSLNSLKNSFLTYWNESINPDTEDFWTALSANGIDYQRKEPLRFVLVKNRFSRVDLAIEARKHWSKLKFRKGIIEKFTRIEIERIGNIIAEDENRRLEILKKCLRKNEIPRTQYLKFGECMAYMNTCGLWDEYFAKEEVLRLNDIWTN